MNNSFLNYGAGVCGLVMAGACAPATDDGTGLTGTDTMLTAASDSMSSVTASGSNSDSNTTSDSNSASDTAGPTSSSTTSDSGGSTGSGPKFDVGAGATTGAGTGGTECGCGNLDWSYIWIVNSSQHTVSKINTRTMTEEGRYYTRADGSGNPSRTSVSIDGRAVVVANRMGGVSKIWARPEDCVDKNSNGMIDTSTGPADILPYDQEECIAWYSFVPDTTVQRPVAWTSGTLNQETCDYDDQKVWTATGRDAPAGQGPNYCGATGTWVHRLNGDTGAVEEEFHIPQAEVPCTFGGSDWGFGYYGGAVDPDNNMWLSTFGGGKLVKVEYDTLAYTVFNGSSYGVTVDTMGRPWVGDSPQRFDEATQTWASANPNLPGAGGAGIAQDHQGRMWTATSNGVGWVDMNTLALGDTVITGGTGIHRGISVDIDGFIWAVPLGGTVAYKIDPDTYDIDQISGLSSPYTYSDMSGGQLSNVTCNGPEG